jgi:hypothetical protein
MPCWVNEVLNLLTNLGDGLFSDTETYSKNGATDDTTNRADCKTTQFWKKLSPTSLNLRNLSFNLLSLTGSLNLSGVSLSLTSTKGSFFSSEVTPLRK